MIIDNNCVTINSSTQNSDPSFRSGLAGMEHKIDYNSNSERRMMKVNK